MIKIIARIFVVACVTYASTNAMEKKKISKTDVAKIVFAASDEFKIFVKTVFKNMDIQKLTQKDPTINYSALEYNYEAINKLFYENKKEAIEPDFKKLDLAEKLKFLFKSKNRYEHHEGIFYTSASLSLLIFASLYKFAAIISDSPARTTLILYALLLAGCQALVNPENKNILNNILLLFFAPFVTVKNGYDMFKEKISPTDDSLVKHFVKELQEGYEI